MRRAMFNKSRVLILDCPLRHLPRELHVHSPRWSASQPLLSLFLCDDPQQAPRLLDTDATSFSAFTPNGSSTFQGIMLITVKRHRPGARLVCVSHLFPVMQMDRFYFGLVRFSNIQILKRFGALISLIWIGFGALARTGSPVKPDLGSIP
jgi:hypothetical protein